MNDEFCRRSFKLQSTNLALAKEECSQNPSCVGFFDNCGKGRTFRYCKHNSKISRSACGSKCYVKGIFRKKFDIFDIHKCLNILVSNLNSGINHPILSNFRFKYASQFSICQLGSNAR